MPRPWLSLLLVASTAACTADAGAGDDPAQPSASAPPSPVATAPAPSAQVESAAVTTNPQAPMAAALSVELSAPAQIEVTATSGDHVVRVPRTADASSSHEIPVVGLRSARSYQIAVSPIVADDPAPQGAVVIDFEVPPLPAWLPDHQVTVVDPDRVSPGITLVESGPKPGFEDAPDGIVIGYDESGEVVWLYTNNGGLAGVEQTTRNTFLAHYWPFGIREFDLTGRVVGNWRPEVDVADGDTAPDVVPDANAGDADPVEVRADWIELRTFHHENWPLPNGNVLALSTTLHELTPEQRAAICPGDPNEFDAISDVAVEFRPDGTVVRTWDLWDVVDVVAVPGSGMCAEPGLFSSSIARDWTHANSVVYDTDRDAVIISSRHTDQIIAMEYGAEPGPQSELRWIIGVGGTIPLTGTATLHQHAVEVLADDEIIIYDNGNDRPGTSLDETGQLPYSRAVIYRVDDSAPDPATWSVEEVWEHRMAGDDGTPVYTAFIGDADQLAKGNVLITHGGIGTFPPTDTDPLRALIVEVERGGPRDGEVVWRFESDPASGYTVYRSERIDSFYTGPTWESAP